MTTLGELAKALELELRGDPTRSIDNLAAVSYTHLTLPTNREV